MKRKNRVERVHERKVTKREGQTKMKKPQNKESEMSNYGGLINIFQRPKLGSLGLLPAVN